MTRLRSLLAVVVPSMLVGGLVGFGRAAAGDDSVPGYWPAPSDAATSDRGRKAKRPPVPDRWASPFAPYPSVPPVPPVPPHHRGGKISVTIHGNHIQINGIAETVNEHLDAVRDMLQNNPNVPPDVRDRIIARMDRVKSIVDRRLKNFKVSDVDQAEAEMEKLGEELEQALDGLDQDLEKLGDKLARDIRKKVRKNIFKDFAKKFVDVDHRADRDDDNDGDAKAEPDSDSEDADPSDVDDTVRSVDGLKGMTLKPEQRVAIAKLRVESNTRVATAKKQLEDASQRLETALSDPKISDADVVRLVDQVSGHEAAIRKARLLAWIQARRVLDADQVERIERAAK